VVVGNRKEGMVGFGRDGGNNRISKFEIRDKVLVFDGFA
jgi:hypothetical protein